MIKVLVIAAALMVATTTDASSRLGDLDGDGRDDVLLRRADGHWLYQAMAGRETREGASGALGLVTNAAWQLAGVGDFNGDGRDDVLLRRTDGVWTYYAMNGRAVVSSESGWANLARGLDWRVAGIGDLNGDGLSDVLLRRLDGTWAYYPMNGRRTIAAEHGWARLTRNTDWRIAGVGDLGGDGRDGVLLRHADGRWLWNAMNGRHVVSAGRPGLPTDRNWRFEAIADLNGDGTDDVLLRHVNGRWRYYAMREGRVARRDSGRASLPVDRIWRLAGIGDLDGDGRDDVLLRHAEGRWHARRMNGRLATPGGRGPVRLPRDRDWRIPAAPVYVPDPNLRDAIESVLRKPSGAWVTRRELDSVYHIRVESADVEDLTGLRFATNLHSLWARRNEIADLSPLADASSLLRLEVSSNRVADIAALAGLTQLTELFLHWNRIADISALSALTRLTQLTIGENDIEDLSPLSGMTELQFLGAAGNRIATVAPLSALSGLRILLLSSNEIVDVSPLSGLVGLTNLQLGSNDIFDISPLASLAGLTTLHAGSNDIFDIRPLAGLTQLTSLWLGGNHITDLAPLSGLMELSDLHLSANYIVDVSPLAELEGLDSLRITHNDIEDIGALESLTGLTELALRGNRIRDVSVLAHLTGLADLDLTYNQIADLTPLLDNAGLGPGDRVDARENPLSEHSLDVVAPALAERGVEILVGPWL